MAATSASQSSNPTGSKRATTAGATINLTIPKNRQMGCEHVYQWYNRPNTSKELSLAVYVKKLDSVVDVRKEMKTCTTCGELLGSLHLCFECSELNCLECAESHAKGEEHNFSMNYRNGCVWCHVCRDYVYDAEFERARCAHEKVIAITNYRKRKRPTAQEMLYIDNNSLPWPCKSTGLRGLTNFGSTCFISVSLLSLVHNPILRHYFAMRPHAPNGPSECNLKDCIICALNVFFDQFWGDDALAAFTPASIVAYTAKRIPSIRIDKQGDPSQYLGSVFDKLCEDSNGRNPIKGKCNCISHQAFHWREGLQKRCKSCKAVTTDQRVSGHLMLFDKPPLSICSTTKAPGESGSQSGGQNSSRQKQALSVRLDKLIEQWGKEQESNRSCEKCKTSGNVVESLSFKSFPIVATLYFPWVKQADDNNRYFVDCPLSIDLKGLSTAVRTGQAKIDEVPSVWYDLFFSTVHQGEDNRGHYYSYTRDKDGQWFMMNDSNVFTASEQDMQTAGPMMLSYVLRKLPDVVLDGKSDDA